MFSGPPKDVVYMMARGVASMVMQIEMLRTIPFDDRQKVVEAMKAEGKPSSMQELVRSAASVVAEQKMGFVRKNQYLAAIEAYLVTMGMSRSDAGHWKRLIEIGVR